MKTKMMLPFILCAIVFSGCCCRGERVVPVPVVPVNTADTVLVPVVPAETVVSAPVAGSGGVGGAGGVSGSGGVSGQAGVAGAAGATRLTK